MAAVTRGCCGRMRGVGMGVAAGGAGVVQRARVPALRPRWVHAARPLPPTLAATMHDAEARLAAGAAGAPSGTAHGAAGAPHAAAPGADATTAVSAWISSLRRQKQRTFVELTDGTLGGDTTLQAVFHTDARDLAPGTAVRVRGAMVPGRAKKAGQRVELQVDSYDVLATSDAATYPLANVMQRGGSPREAAADVVRHKPHWKPRTAHYAAIARTRSRVEHAMGAWFAGDDFVKVHPPVVTSSDCEGGGEIFRVVADTDVAAAPAPLQRAHLTQFWNGHDAYLSVSTQLHLEAYALGLSRVWTFCPVFRAEGSSTNRHLAEFWMCEAELCWTPPGADGLAMLMDCVEGVLRAAAASASGIAAGGEPAAERHAQRAHDDMRLLLRDDADRTSFSRAWPRITYTDAVRALRAHHRTHPFEHEPVWGTSLRSEHERWLAADAGVPVFVTDYPSAGKPFYMRQNSERVPVTADLRPGAVGASETTVSCFDLLVPGVGELVGGSMREEREDTLAQRMTSLGLSGSTPSMAWYTEDLRRYGGAPHGGFGIGMERLLSWLTRTENVRDIVGFPRVKGTLRY
ncbi:asparagine--tRNA ligase [Malassezia sp. CBS 17886]|nr:asparagine--tRNA ligase [Malassezia sp. CBS 17886]